MMLTMIMMILFFVVFGKMIGFAIRVGWGISKFVAYLILLPAIVLMMIFGGLLYLAFPILIVAGLAGMLERV